MNRREVLQGAVASAWLSAGVSGSAKIKVHGDHPLLVTVEVDREITAVQRQQIRKHFTELLKGTELEGVPISVTGDGVSVNLCRPLSDEQMDAIADRVLSRLNERQANLPG